MALMKEAVGDILEEKMGAQGIIVACWGTANR
jgi:hypothetical protein